MPTGVPNKQFKRGKNGGITLIEWLSTQDLSLSNHELAALAAKLFKTNHKRISNVRFVLKNKYGISEKSQTKKEKVKETKTKSNGARVPAARALKQAQLRKLVFEMGYDEVREIFLEFEAMHETFKGV